MANGKRLVILGCGQMGEAILAGLLRGGTFAAGDIFACEALSERRSQISQAYPVHVCESHEEALPLADIILLAVKPQQLEGALASLMASAKPGAILLSIVAGAPLQRLMDGSGLDAVVRVMPNTPARIGKGISAWISSPGFHESMVEDVQAILKTMGQEMRVKDEAAMDMVTAVSGSGPAYVYLFTEAYVDAAVQLGLGRDAAKTLVLQTILGSVEYMRTSTEHTAVLRDQVTSPGGTTAAALHCLEREGFRNAISQAVWAAYERSRELGQGQAGKKPR